MKNYLRNLGRNVLDGISEIFDIFKPLNDFEIPVRDRSYEKDYEAIKSDGGSALNNTLTKINSLDDFSQL